MECFERKSHTYKIRKYQLHVVESRCVNECVFKNNVDNKANTAIVRSVKMMEQKIITHTCTSLKTSKMVNTLNRYHYPHHYLYLFLHLIR